MTRLRTTVLIGILLSDLTYALVDPRIDFEARS